MGFARAGMLARVPPLYHLAHAVVPLVLFPASMQTAENSPVILLALVPVIPLMSVPASPLLPVLVAVSPVVSVHVTVPQVQPVAAAVTVATHMRRVPSWNPPVVFSAIARLHAVLAPGQKGMHHLAA